MLYAVLQFPGCQESCKFYYSTPDPNADASAVPDTNFTRPLIYRYQPERDAIHFEWSRPASISDSDEPFVYVLTLQDQLSRYSQEIEQTLYQNATVRRSLMKSSTIILLTAYSFSGKVAQLETRCSDLEVCVNPSREASEETFSDAKYITHDVGKHHRPEDASVNNSNHSFWSPSLVSLQYSMKDLDGVDALVTWPHVRQLDNVKYQVEWSRVEHDVDVMTSLVTQDNVATIAVWPNNVYHVHVRVFSNESRRTLTKSQPLTINTTSNSLSSNDLDCYRFKYNMALLFAVIFGLASAAVLISICLRKFRFRLI